MEIWLFLTVTIMTSSYYQSSVGVSYIGPICKFPGLGNIIDHSLTQNPGEPELRQVKGL